MQHGLQYDDKTIQVTLNCIVCAAPARAMVMATKQFSGHYVSDRCEQKGVWFGRVKYPDVEKMVQTLQNELTMKKLKATEMNQCCWMSFHRHL